TGHDAAGMEHSQVVRGSYDRATGHLLSYTDGNQHTTSYQYDALGRLTQIVHPDSSHKQWTYDDAANQLTVTDETGATRIVKYNPLGLEVEDGILNNGTYQAKMKYGYDAFGRRIWTEDAVGNRTVYLYDDWGRLIETDNPDQS